MKSVNKWIGVGNLADAPKVRQAGDTDVANFSIATEEGWYNKTKVNDDGSTGGWESRTTWHRVVKWKPSKTLKEAKKGDRVYVSGPYESTSWQDSNTGETRYSMEVKAYEAWVIPRGGGAFQTEPEKEAKKEAKNDLDEALGVPPENGAGFPEAPY